MKCGARTCSRESHWPYRGLSGLLMSASADSSPSGLDWVSLTAICVATSTNEGGELESMGAHSQDLVVFDLVYKRDDLEALARACALRMDDAFGVVMDSRSWCSTYCERTEYRYKGGRGEHDEGSGWTKCSCRIIPLGWSGVLRRVQPVNQIRKRA